MKLMTATFLIAVLILPIFAKPEPVPDLRLPAAISLASAHAKKSGWATNYHMEKVSLVRVPGDSYWTISWTRNRAVEGESDLARLITMFVDMKGEVSVRVVSGTIAKDEGKDEAKDEAG